MFMKIIAFLTGLLLIPACFAADTEGRTIMDELNMSAKEVQKLESGEVLTKLASEYEQSPRELAIDATVLIRKPLSELAAESEDDITLVPGKLILDSSEVLGEDDFAGVEFSAEEAEEARTWLNAEFGDDLNVGREDLAIIERIKADRGGRGDVELGSEAARQVLLHRYRQYMRGGLEAIEPYARSKKKNVSVGEELRASNETLQLIEKHFPAYFRALVEFPMGAECCKHRFMWLKAKVRGRPTFILVHRIVMETDEAVLVTERHFYVSHTLNSLQLTLGWVPYETEGEETTYLGIVTSANSDYLTGFVGKLIRVLGANKGAEMVGGVLSDIRDDLEAGRDPANQYED